MDVKTIRNKIQALSSNNGSSKREKIDYSTIYWKPKKEGKYQIRIVPSKYNTSFPFKEFMIHYGYNGISGHAKTFEKWADEGKRINYEMENIYEIINYVLLILD